VKESRQAHKNPIPLQSGIVIREFILEESFSAALNVIKHSGSYVHHAERMLEARVSRTRIYHVRHAELPDAAQSLENLVIDDFPLPLIQAYESVDRIAYLEHIFH
jgi:hypothetical protein